ncbi:hypothetical protein CVIRNUC_005932 [Coccomyxa viridis]|uniref:Photosystem I subunit O n=1 Tax=Coccomyxa viridis TaxID=1274662 RepID=A0AAV1I7M6_9CHLO|nr:hypothetical protein CVIRNUC_005932 [Coccomyxa viridis]
MALAMKASLGSAQSVHQSCHRAGFLGSRAPLAVAVRASRIQNSRQMTVMAGQEYPSNWLNKDPLVLVLGFLGWTVPANIPVPAFGGSSLFGTFTQSIGENLARFPQGPPLQDKFWLLLVTYHVGLFTALLLGQIGVNGRKQGYW